MLLTKIHIPKPSKNVVHRRNLDDILDEGLNRKLILVSASAGYGKTTAIVDWIGRNKLPCAWYSLDENDNDLKIFLSYVIKGFQTIDESIGLELQQSLNSSVNVSAETGVELFIADLLKIEKDILLVLDDFHYIVDREIVKFISYFLEYLPKNIHLVLITRNDPTLKISKLRSRQQLVELRSAELRFSTGDVSEFFKKSYDFNLSDSDANELQIKTEGWISGILLAGLSIQSYENISSFIEQFRGSNRYIMDYLIDEALSTLDVSVKDFLLKTSILKRFCPELCDYMLDSNISHEVIQQLEASNMFIVPLDNERKWYRFHHLFSELLNKRLNSSYSGQLNILHQLAGEWLISNHLLEDAIEHILLANQHKKAAELISKEMLKIWDDGNHYRFSPWLKSLPENIVNELPQLIILKAELAMINWEIESALILLRNAADLLKVTENNKDSSQITFSEKEFKNLKGRILINYGLIASFDNNNDDILKYADEALQVLSEDQVMLRNLAFILQGDAYFYNGRLNKAHEVQLETNKSNQIAQNSFLYLISGSYLATTLRQQGKLGEVLELCDKLFKYSFANSLKNAASLGWIQIQKGEILAEFNDLDRAEKIALQGIETARKFKLVSGLLKGYLLLIRIYFSAKKYTEIDKVLVEIQNESSGHGNTIYNVNQIEAWKIKISVSQEQFQDIEQWLNEYEASKDTNLVYINESKHLAASRAYIALGKFEEAEGLLEKLKAEAKKNERINTLIELYILKAHLEYHRGEIENAKAHLSNAFSLSEPGGYIRSYIDEGPVIEEITRKLQKEDSRFSLKTETTVSGAYINQILRAFEIDKKKKEPEEELSSRELEILQLISQKLSNKEICDALYISLSTVKTHISNILLKLEAKNRQEATEIAREKGLI